MAHRRQRKNNIIDSEDDIDYMNLDKDDEDIEFNEEKEINEKDEEKEDKNKKDSKIEPLLSLYSGQTKNKFPIIRKHARNIYYSSSSSSSSDELNQKIKKDLAENLNSKLTNFQKSQAESQREIFENNYNVLKNDFKIIEQYEQKVFEDISIDIMFIMDLTESMGEFLYEAKHNIKKVIEEIYEINPGAKIRLSFVGYRDFDNIGEKRKYEIVDFTENIETFILSIKKFECYGGGDQPEDIAGALNEALKLNWKSNAKYVVLVCDAPCHGKKYHDIDNDTFSNGDPDGLVIEDLMLKFKLMNITFYCIEINDSTQKMFEIMNKVYDDENRFSVELVGTASEKLTNFVAFSASELLGNTKYDKCSFSEVLDKFRKESIEKIMKKYNKKNNINIKDDDIVTQSLINQLDNIKLDGEDKKLVEFINRMNNLYINNTNENIIEEENRDNDYNYLHFNEDLLFMIQGNDINYKINGITYNKNDIKGITSFMNPEIIEQSFNTNIKINFGLIYNNNTFDYNRIFIYDNLLGKQIEGKIPKKIKKEYYNNIKLFTKEKLLNDLICEQIADYFNIQIRSESMNFIKFKKYVVYEKEDNKVDDSIKIILGEISSSFPVSISEIPNKRILQAFSHFSYQLTFGELIITDLVLDKKSKKIESYNIYFLKEKGYKKILEFFSDHVCNDICKHLELVNPRNKRHQIEINVQFYSRKYLINSKLCKCCSIPLRITNNENYCCKCMAEKSKSIKKIVCQECHSLFEYSFYEYNSLLINYPKKCKKCCKLF